MATSSASNTGLKIITTGTEEGSWGDITNDNMTAIDKLVSGAELILSDANTSIPYVVGSGSNAFAYVVAPATTWTADRTITLPAGTERIHVISNLSGDGFKAIIAQAGAGGTEDVPDGYTTVVRGSSGGAINALGNLCLTGVSGSATQITPSGGNATLNCAAGNYHYVTVSGAVTWTFSNPPTSGYAYRFQLEITNGGTGTQTWPGTVQWPGGTAPTLQAAGLDIVEFVTRDGGTTYNGYLQMGNLS